MVELVRKSPLVCVRRRVRQFMDLHVSVHGLVTRASPWTRARVTSPWTRGMCQSMDSRVSVHGLSTCTRRRTTHLPVLSAFRARCAVLKPTAQSNHFRGVPGTICTGTRFDFAAQHVHAHTLQTQTQETALLVQAVLKMQFLVSDFGVHLSRQHFEGADSEGPHVDPAPRSILPRELLVLVTASAAKPNTIWWC